MAATREVGLRQRRGRNTNKCHSFSAHRANPPTTTPSSLRRSVAPSLLKKMLQLERVYKSYRRGPQRIDALKGVDLSVEAPCFCGVMGPSGSGKTTLLQLIAGLDRPDEGRVVVDNIDLAGLSESKLSAFRRRSVGIIFQQYNLISTLSGRQNIALPGVLDRRPRQWIDRRVDELVEQLGIADRASHRPDALSGGEQQRMAIARALLLRPSVLLADEPTGALDSTSSDLLWQLLADLARQQQITVLMVTHEPAAAIHCHRVFVLADGSVRGQFEVDRNDASNLATRYQQLSG